MKKISFLALAFISALAVSAQQDPDKAHKPLRTEMSQQIRFGLRSGVNIATYEIDDDSQSPGPDVNTKTSFHGGAFVNIPIAGAFRIQPEVDFSAQGTKYDNANSTIGNLEEEDVYYINVPVMLQLQSSGGFFVETGPQIGFLIKGETEGTGVFNDVDIKDQRKGIDFAWGGGLGYLSRIGLGVNARYNLGLSNILNNDDSPSTDEGKLKTRTLQIGLVYHFGAAK